MHFGYPRFLQARANIKVPRWTFAAVADFTITEQRSNVITFSTPLEQIYHAVFIQNPVNSFNFVAFTSPLTNLTWLIFLAWITATPPILFFLARSISTFYLYVWKCAMKGEFLFLIFQIWGTWWKHKWIHTYEGICHGQWYNYTKRIFSFSNHMESKDSIYQVRKKEKANFVVITCSVHKFSNWWPALLFSLGGYAHITCCDESNQNAI